jgi:hypothetical protein
LTTVAGHTLDPLSAHLLSSHPVSQRSLLMLSLSHFQEMPLHYFHVVTHSEL